jgi:class 3 adenylate cyclase
MEERGIARRQQRQPPAIAFLDLTGYTELAEEHGDETATEIATCLGDIVRQASAAHGASGQVARRRRHVPDRFGCTV